jgi:SpoVK/Ycf46/Vps4 family AAA+-type ATPase
LTIKDLLEIFQGVVDVDGRLIFAMTNHYDKIKKECPALFRPGRLTPVYFGYIGQETLLDIIKYYFKKSDPTKTGLDALPSEFQIPTSEIIEQAIYFSGRGADGYSKFMQWLQVRCQEQPS